MKKIYIILSYTGTALSRIIKTYTKDEFSHVSISLDKEMNEMYSFGRLNPYNPFWGGFVRENPNFGTFKRFSKTVSAVYSLDVTDLCYKKIKKHIKNMKKNKDKYGFNIIGLFLVALNIKFTMKDHYYCAEFVKMLLEDAKVHIDLPRCIKPEDFKFVEQMDLTYKGLFKNYIDTI